MEWLSEWIKQIIVVVIVATCLDLLLPNQAMERYVKLIMGLVIIMIMLTPIYQLCKQKLHLALPAFEMAEQTGGATAVWQTEGERLRSQQQDMIKQQTEQQLQQLISTQVSRHFNVDVTQCLVGLGVTGTELTQISLTVKPTSANKDLTPSITSYLQQHWGVTAQQVAITNR